MTTWVLLQLLGILLEIVAGFILSLHALGLERVHGWAVALTDAVAEVWTREPGPKIDLRHPGFLFCLTCTLLTTGVVAYFLHHPQWAASMQTGISVWICALAAGIGSGMFMFGVVYATRSLVRFLLAVHTAAVIGTAGVFGFVLLFFGFLLQFFGTLGQAIAK